MKTLTDSDKQLIDRYLALELSEDEYSIWEDRMRDPVFKNAASSYQTTIKKVVESYQDSPIKTSTL